MIDATGNQIGIMSAREAQALADRSGLDLIKISPNAKPPVCRIADYGKYRFEQAKREKEARKNQHVVDVKEVRLGLNTEGQPCAAVHRTGRQGQGLHPFPRP